jgi:hypothetical protein
LRLEAAEDLEATLQALTSDRYAALRRALAAAPRSTFVADREDCTALVERILGRPPASASGHARRVA